MNLNNQTNEQININNDDYIISGSYGAKFIASLHKAVERMRTEKNDTQNDFLDDALQLLEKGFETKEPTMMYLAAEYARISESVYYTMKHAPEGIHLGFVNQYKVNENNHILASMAFDGNSLDVDTAMNHFLDYDSCIFYPEQMYLMAAQAGSVHAILWCAYHYDLLPERYWKYRDFVPVALHLDTVPDTIRLRELDFLNDDLKNLYERGYYTDMDEDYACLDYSEGPDPDSNVLDLRIKRLRDFMCSLGQAASIYSYSDYAHCPEKKFKDSWQRWKEYFFKRSWARDFCFCGDYGSIKDDPNAKYYEFDYGMNYIKEDDHGKIYMLRTDLEWIETDYSHWWAGSSMHIFGGEI